MSDEDGMIEVSGKPKKRQPRHSRGKLKFERNPKAPPRMRRQGKPQTCMPFSAPMAVIPTRAIADPNVSDVALRVLATIAAYQNRAGLAWPSMERVAAHCDLHESVAWENLRALVKAGHVQKLGRYTIAGVAYSNTYRIVFDPNITAEDAVAAQTAADLEDAERKGIGTTPTVGNVAETQEGDAVIQNQRQNADNLSMIEEVVSAWYEASQRWGRPRPPADATRDAARALVLQGATAQAVRARIEWLWQHRRPLPVALAGLKAADLK